MYCTRHGRYRCMDSVCRRTNPSSSSDTSDNAGQLSVDPTTGDLNIGLGGGLTMDLDDGDLGIQIAPGLSLDF